MDTTRQKPRLSYPKMETLSPEQYAEFTCCKQNRKFQEIVGLMMSG